MVKDPALSLQWLRSLLWFRFDPWPRNFCLPQVQPKNKKKKKKKKKKSERNVLLSPQRHMEVGSRAPQVTLTESWQLYYSSSP